MQDTKKCQMMDAMHCRSRDWTREEKTIDKENKGTWRHGHNVLRAASCLSSMW